jgi:hypothetical protein
MNFEQQVLTTVEQTLGTLVATADFFGGSLFVECTVPQAVKLKTALLNSLDCGIIMSRVGAESAFDFI